MVQLGTPLGDLTTLGVGGPAALICSIENPEQARRFHDIVQNSGKPLFILGGGSNVLADDEGFEGVVLKVTADNYDQQGDIITVGAGYDFDNLIAQVGGVDHQLVKPGRCQPPDMVFYQGYPAHV